jgi:hypothetical protein
MDTLPSHLYTLVCGVDSFVLRSLETNETVFLRKKGIAWESDVSQKFNNPPVNSPGIRVIPDMRDEDFIVWMRIAGLPTFRKLYRIIDTDLYGNFTIEIGNSILLLSSLFTILLSPLPFIHFE